MLTFGNDETLIRADLTARGVKWPEENCKLPVPTILTREFIFEGEDCTTLKNRVSEFARVVMHLARQKMSDPEKVVRHFKENGGLRGLYAKLDAEGNVRILDGEDGPAKPSDAPKPNTVNPPAIACQQSHGGERVDRHAPGVEQPMHRASVSAKLAAAVHEYELASQSATQANKDLSRIETEAEQKAQVEQTKLTTQQQALIADAKVKAVRAAEMAQPLQQRVNLLRRIEKLPVWAVVKVSEGRLPPESAHPNSAGDHFGVSVLIVHNVDHETVEILANVTPPPVALAKFLDDSGLGA